MLIVEAMAGAALGLALQMLQEAIKSAKDRSKTTKCILDRLDATVIRIVPLVVQVDKLSESVEVSLRKVIEDLNVLLEKATSLVEAYPELRRRNLLTKYRYKRRIQELEASLRWMVDVDVQLDQWADVKELMAKLSEMNTKLSNITCQPTESHSFKSNHSISSSVISQRSNQNILEATDRSSEKNEGSSNNESELKIDIHLRWSSRKRNKDREIRFFVK